MPAQTAVITGTNSNLGLNLAFRLLDEIPENTDLTLVVTSRTLPRVKEAISMIQTHAKKRTKRTGQLEFDYILVDFTNMVSVLDASHELSKKFSHIDYVFVNAAHGVYDGIDWYGACKAILNNLLDAVTFPTYKLQRVGVRSEDGMGAVFQGNVFGPYYLLRRIRSLLADGGKVIWISSIMSHPKYLSFDDLQLVRTNEPYEGSKRLVDLVHCGTWQRLKLQGIGSYVVHPGIFTSFSFFQFLNFVTYYGMMFLFYVARWLGSRIHNIDGYTAANAPVHAALHLENQTRKVASLSDRRGNELLGFEEIDSSGAADVVAYLDKLCDEWDVKFEDQIKDTRLYFTRHDC